MVEGDAVSQPDESTPLDVLVVEDDAYIRTTVADCLRDEGFAVDTSINGAEALALLEGRREDGRPPPRVILLDMRMPVMDGWQFADAYRRTPGPHAAIVVATAGHDVEERARAVGAQGMLPKPFDLDEMVAAVRACADAVGRAANR
jgi:two-component system chemotaxis response regulator CheY